MSRITDLRPQDRVTGAHGDLLEWRETWPQRVKQLRREERHQKQRYLADAVKYAVNGCGHSKREVARWLGADVRTVNKWLNY